MSLIMLAGDVHGCLDDLHNKALELKPDVILQVGDFGLFRNPEQMDSKARKYYLNNEEKRGQSFAYASKEKEFSIPLYFIRGNHEDYEFIKDTPNVSKMMYLPTGVYEIPEINKCVATLGGIWYQGHNPERAKWDRYTQEWEFNYLKRKLKEHFDKPFILLSHDCPQNSFMDVIHHTHGSPYVTEILEKFKPEYLVHGHYHVVNKFYQAGPNTTGIALGEGSTLLWEL